MNLPLFETISLVLKIGKKLDKPQGIDSPAHGGERVQSKGQGEDQAGGRKGGWG